MSSKYGGGTGGGIREYNHPATLSGGRARPHTASGEDLLLGQTLDTKLSVASQRRRATVWHYQRTREAGPVAITDRDNVVAEQSATYRAQRATATALAVWGAGYACYRAYYAAGGEIGMIGQPMSDAQFRAVNAAGAGIVLLGALLPLVLVRAASLRPAVPILAWIVGVGCCMHAFVDGILRLLSLTGVHLTQLPAELWQSFDRRTSDLQDLLLNEPWFLVEGLLWVVLGVASIHSSHLRPWLASAAGAWCLLTVVGVLSGLDVIGSFRIG